jgi:hypothetical protein
MLLGAIEQVYAFINMTIGLLKTIYIVPGLSIWLALQLLVAVSIAMILFRALVTGAREG